MFSRGRERVPLPASHSAARGSWGNPCAPWKACRLGTPGRTPERASQDRISVSPAPRRGWVGCGFRLGESDGGAGALRGHGGPASRQGAQRDCVWTAHGGRTASRDPGPPPSTRAHRPDLRAVACRAKVQTGVLRGSLPSRHVPGLRSPPGSGCSPAAQSGCWLRPWRCFPAAQEAKTARQKCLRSLRIPHIALIAGEGATPSPIPEPAPQRPGPALYQKS